MHIDDGTLRAHIDAALPAAEETAVAAHLAQCARCTERAGEMAEAARRVEKQFATLAPQREPTDARAALVQYKRWREMTVKETKMFNRIFSPRLRVVWATLAALVIVVVAFSFEPVQAWAGQFLSLFRVQQVTVLPIDTTGLTQLTGNQALAKQVSQMMSKSVTVTKEPGQPKTVDSAASASKLAGFTVRLPSSRTDKPQIMVNGSTAFQAVADRAKAQNLLNETGHPDLVLPASIDGAVIKVSIPASVNVGYGSCPKVTTDPDSNGLTGQPGSGTPARQMQGCVMLVEMPSPTVDTPPTLDVQQLVEIGLQFTGMTAEQAKAYSSTVDWTSTLVIPIPRNGSTYQKVNVDGVTGYLIQRPADDAPGYVLVWVKDGIIYTIGGMNSNSAQAIQMANSLQ